MALKGTKDESSSDEDYSQNKDDGGCRSSCKKTVQRKEEILQEKTLTEAHS